MRVAGGLSIVINGVLALCCSARGENKPLHEPANATSPGSGGSAGRGTTGAVSGASGSLSLFGSPSNMSASGVCVLEPQLGSGTTRGALFPANWLRPRFRWAPLPQENPWEVRLHSELETTS
jgi:hypothetical protein